MLATQSDTAAANQAPPKAAKKAAKSAAFGLKGMGFMQAVVLVLAATMML